MSENRKNSIRLWLYFVGSLLYYEALFRVLTIRNVHSADLWLTLLFSLALASLFYLIASLFKGRYQIIVSIVILVIVFLLFASQLVYFKIFDTLYSTYSVMNMGQVTEFYPFIIRMITVNFGWILLLSVPVVGFFLTKQWLFPIISKRSVLALALVFHLLALLVIESYGPGVSSAFDTYYHTNAPALSLQKFGLVSTMRIDLQRVITGWTPTLREEVPQEPIIEKPPKPIPEKEKVYYNSMAIDFNKLIENESNPDIIALHEYFRSVQPSKKNEYTGLFKDYNLIFITAESFSHLAIDPELTPTLYKMSQEGFQFPNFYTPIWEVSTSDGEYVANTSLIPKSGVWSFSESSDNALPFVMGNQLKKQGYSTRAYHNHTYTYYDRHKSHPNMGYEYLGVGNGLEVTDTWPESDLEMMELTVDDYINDNKFHTYYMTVSGHMLYTFNGNAMATKNQEFVNHLDYSEGPKAYLASQIEFDKAMEYLLNRLEEKGIAEKTLIVISADHYPYGLSNQELSELSGHPIEENVEIYKNELIIYAKGMEPVIIDRIGSSLDIIPTISNLMGLEYDSRLLMGQDLLSDTEPLVLFLNRSFLTNECYYNAITNETNCSKDELEQTISTVQRKFYYSAKMLETDYYRHLPDE